MQKKPFIYILFFILFLTSLFSEAVYDSSGRIIRSSTWLPSTGKSKQKTEIPSKIEDVVKENNSDDEPLVQDQQSMKEVNVISDHFYDSETIENSNTQSLPDFLQQKGFLIMASGGKGTKTELSYKGYTAFCIKVYVDGILSNSPTTGEFDWNSIDIDSIESIVITEAPQIGISEFAGASILITTKGNKKGFLATDTAFSSYETNFMDEVFQSVNYGAAKGKFYYRAGASVSFSDNEYSRGKNEVTGRPEINKSNFSKMANANFGWNANLNSNWSFSGSDSFAYNQVKAHGTGDKLTSGIEEDFTTQNSVTAVYQKDNFRSQTIFSYFYGQVDYLNSYTRNRTDMDITNVQNISLRENVSWIFDVSAGYREEHLFSNQSDRHELDLGISKEHEWGLFKFTPCVQFLTYGTKSQFFNDAQYNWNFEFLPRLTVSFADWVTVSASRTMVLPTFNQLFWPESGYASGNPELDPEQGWSITAGLKNQKIPVYGRFTYSYYENKIRWASVGGKLLPSNTKNADYYVGVLGYDQEVWKNHLKLQADGTLTKAILRDTKTQIMWVPLYQIHAGAEFNYKGFEAQSDYVYTSYRFCENENLTFYPGFHMLDVTLAYQFNPEFKIYIRGTNLIDENVPYHDGYYLPSRKWTLGMKINR